MKHLSTATESALLILAMTLIFIAESRTLMMRLTFAILWIVVSGRDVWRMYKSGVLTQTPGQIYRTAGTRPRTSLLNGSAILIGTVALIFVVI
jgi:hypothetical protein